MDATLTRTQAPGAARTSTRPVVAGTTRLKLRPDAHYAPVAGGIFWSRPDGTSFVLSGPPALYQLVDAGLAQLAEGTTVDELVAAAGSEAARPVLVHIATTLLVQRILFDVDVAGPLPDEATRSRFAEVLAYLECRCAAPYDAFARLRNARVVVAGAGAAAASARRGLADFGITALEAETGHPERPVEAAVLVDDVDHRADLAALLAQLPGGTAAVPVLAGPHLAVVGTAVADADALASFVAAAARCAEWQLADRSPGAPRPMSAALAGSLAAREVLDQIIGASATATATLVHGRSLECRRIPLAVAHGIAWSDIDSLDQLDRLDRLDQLDSLDGADAVDGPSSTGARDESEPPQGSDGDVAKPRDPVYHHAARLTARWTGLAQWGDDLDLPQLPFALATARGVALSSPSQADAVVAGTQGTSEPAVLGWGSDRAGAGIDALLCLLRRQVAARWPVDAGAVSAAGASVPRFVVDGMLRFIGDRCLLSPAARELEFADARSWTERALWRAITDYFDMSLRLFVRQVPQLSWQLVTATDETGTPLAHEWGPTLRVATRAALGAVVARQQLAEAALREEPHVDLLGTQLLRTASEEEIERCRGELAGWTAGQGLRTGARLLRSDPVTGPLGLACGWVRVG